MSNQFHVQKFGVFAVITTVILLMGCKIQRNNLAVETKPRDLSTYALGSFRVSTYPDFTITLHMPNEEIKSIKLNDPLLADSVNIEENNIIQYSAATKQIVYRVVNDEVHHGSDDSIPFCDAIFATDFEGSIPKLITFATTCSLGRWIAHPTRPLLITVDDKGQFTIIDLNNFSNLKKIDSAPENWSFGTLHVSSDGRYVAQYSDHPNCKTVDGYRKNCGRLTTLDLDTDTASTIQVSYPALENGESEYMMGLNLSSDLQHMAYGFGLLNIKNGFVKTFSSPENFKIANVWKSWSLDGTYIYFEIRVEDNGRYIGDRDGILYNVRQNLVEKRFAGGATIDELESYKVFRDSQPVPVL